MANVSAAIIIALVFFIAIPILQWFLSKSESRAPGLVMPGISLLLSLIPLLSFTAEESMSLLAVKMLLVVALYNIPTVILLAIYFTVRSKKRKKSAVDKMNIQDL